MEQGLLSPSERAMLERINAAQRMTLMDGIKIGAGIGIVLLAAAGIMMVLMVFRALMYI